MEYSIILAKIWAIFFTIIAIWLVVYRNALDIYIRDFVYHPLVFFNVIWFIFIIGIILVVTHSIWVLDWRLVLTILNWLVLIKGVLLLFFQNKALMWVLGRRSITKLFFGQISIVIVLAIFFIYFGFFN